MTVSHGRNHHKYVSVYSIYNMFQGATNFNQPLGNWNVSKASERMHNMFDGASSFNQSLEKWNVSEIEDVKKGT